MASSVVKTPVSRESRRQWLLRNSPHRPATLAASSVPPTVTAVVLVRPASVATSKVVSVDATVTLPVLARPTDVRVDAATGDQCAIVVCAEHRHAAVLLKHEQVVGLGRLAGHRHLHLVGAAPTTKRL